MSAAVTKILLAGVLLSPTVQSAPQGTVRVIRDRFGVPHMLETTDEGAYYGAGYTAAQDRLLQMLVVRAIYKGEISKTLGAHRAGADNRYLQHDRVSRLVGWRRHAVNEASLLDPELGGFFQVYCDGVNAYLSGVLAGSLPTPPRWSELVSANQSWSLDTSPWEVEDCIGVWNRFASNFQSLTAPSIISLVEQKLSLRDEFDVLVAQGKTDSEIIDELFRFQYCDDQSAAISLQSDFGGDLANTQNYAAGLGVNLMTQCSAGISTGPRFSNAWAVGGARTTSGESVLVGDPRIPVGFPSPLYEFHMQGSTIDVAGAGVPGCPAVAFGGTPTAAWTATSLVLDQQDVALLHL